jgi:hypothetical protein
MMLSEVIFMPKKAEKNMCNPHFVHACHGGAIYGLGFIGAAVYYISTATSFWMAVLGILKAMVWPAFVVYGLVNLFGL